MEFHVLLSNTNNSIQYLLFFCTQLSSYKRCNLTQIILFNITHLLAHSEKVSRSQCSQELQSISLLLNGFMYCYVTLMILFDIYHLSA